MRSGWEQCTVKNPKMLGLMLNDEAYIRLAFAGWLSLNAYITSSVRTYGWRECRLRISELPNTADMSFLLGDLIPWTCVVSNIIHGNHQVDSLYSMLDRMRIGCG